MTLDQLLQDTTTWLAWIGLALAVLTLISFVIRWGPRFRLIGTTIFTFLLSGSCWAFSVSYTPPFVVEGAKYAPVVYDNGNNLVIAQAAQDFPNEAIEPTLKQIAGNLKGRSLNSGLVHVRLRQVQQAGEGVSIPIILGEVTNIVDKTTTNSSIYKKNNE